MSNYFKFIDTQKLDDSIKSERFPFNEKLFWDCPIENIDLKKNKRFVIERVLVRGFTNDFYLLQKIYTVEEIREALRKSRELDPKTIQFCSWYFKIPQSEMHVSSFYH